MRGEERRQRAMLVVINPEQRVPKGHPLRRIKALADAALAQLSPVFDEMYSAGGTAVFYAPGQTAAAFLENQLKRPGCGFLRSPRGRGWHFKVITVVVSPSVCSCLRHELLKHRDRRNSSLSPRGLK